MTYEVYRYIFIGGAILAVIMFVVSVLVFVFLKIPTVIGYFTGANQRKAIENIYNKSTETGDEPHRTSRTNHERGKLTDKISQSGRLIQGNSHSLHGVIATAKISTQQLVSADTPANETTVLGGELTYGASETTVLAGGDYSNETTVLNMQNFSNGFVIEYEITYIHTDEVIA